LKLILILGLFFPASTLGQVQVDVGASSIYSSNIVGGAGINLYARDQQTYFGGSFVRHHFLPGGFERFKLHDNSIITVGSQPLTFSFDGIGIGLSCVCISVRTSSNRLSVSGFVGTVGDGYFFPWSSEAMPSRFGSGILVSYKFKPKTPKFAGCQGFGCPNRALLEGLTLYSLDLISGSKLTAAQGVGYEYRRNFKLSMTGGLLDSRRFLDATAIAQFTGINLFATHQEYFKSSVSFDARGNSVGAGYHHSFFGLFGSLNESLSNNIRATGENASASINIKAISIQEGWYHSQTTLISHNFSERISRHLLVSQTVNQSQGKNFYGVGGSWTTNRISLALGHSIQFVIGPHAGYEQVTNASISIRIRDTQLTAATIADPFGKTRWTGGMESFVQTNLLPATPEHQHNNGGKYLFSGIVQDESGKMVAGACLRIGRQIVYSNDQGIWSLRSRTNNPQPITVLVDEFQLGTWQIVSAPSIATAGEQTIITVKRKP
jgi:hypothetical protein